VLDKAGNAWTSDPDRAMQFANSIEAMEFCIRNNLLNAKVLLRFGSEQFDILLETRSFPGITPNRRPRLMISSAT